MFKTAMLQDYSFLLRLSDLIVTVLRVGGSAFHVAYKLKYRPTASERRNKNGRPSLRWHRHHKIF